jgi:hypothetical protein
MRFLVVALLAFMHAVAPARAVDWDATFALGLSLPGSAEARDHLGSGWKYDLDKPAAPLLKVALDLYPLPYLGGGPFVCYGWAPLDEEVNLGNWDGRDHTIPSSGISMILVGGCVKGRFYPAEGVALKPAVGLSFLQSFSDSPDARMKGIVVNAACEVEHPITRTLNGVLEAGFAAQPYGGVQDIAYITFGPIFYVMIGLSM